MTEPTPGSPTTFGELLKHLRRRMQLTQQELGIALGYSATMVARLENGERLPDVGLVKTAYVEALGLEREPDLAARLIELAEHARGDHKSHTRPDSPLVIYSYQPSAPRVTNLPVPLTRFVGREKDIRQVSRLIDTSRLVTLTGSGGVGKTRLAIEVGSLLVRAEHRLEQQVGPEPASEALALTLPEFRDGVWLVELAPVRDVALVPSAVAQVFKLQQRGDHSPMESLGTYLGDQHLLLVLDNCEHLIGACAALAETLLQACPHLVILATSREPLRVPGEVIWRVVSLQAPDPAHLPPLEQLLDNEAVRLFVQHASAAQPEFNLTPENVLAVAQICHELDGIPLAIEMAAARMRAMTAEELASRLDQRFQLLTSGRRSALPRHQTLRATLEWSYQLLDEHERKIFERLSVFADGCLADAAQVVCADPVPAIKEMTDVSGDVSGVTSDKILPLLLRLVDKSLVVADARSGQTRYRMLDTVRQFAAECLREHRAEEEAILYRRHMDFLIQLGTRPLREMMIRQVKTDWINRLGMELESARVLRDWARTRQDDGANYLHLAWGVYPLWITLGHLSEGQAWLEDALARGAKAPAEARVPALTYLALIRSERFDYLGAETAARECLNLATVNHQHHIAIALFVLGQVALWRRDFKQTSECWEQSLDLFRQVQDYALAAYSLVALGWARLQQGDRAKAIENLEEGIALGLQYDDLGTILNGLRYLSIADLHLARTWCERLIARQRESDHRRGLARSLRSLGEILMVSGDLEKAHVALEESLSLSTVVDDLDNARTLFELARLTWLQGDCEQAVDGYQRCLKQFQTRGEDNLAAHTHLWMGYAALTMEDLAIAADHFSESLRAWQADGLVALALAAMAKLAETRGAENHAAQLYGAAAVREEIVQTSVPPIDRLMFDRDVLTARGRLSDPIWAMAWAEGAAMTLQEVVANALTSRE